MLNDSKIESLDTHLEQFKFNEQTRQGDLNNLLKEYAQLLDNYKVLKEAYKVKDGELVDLAAEAQAPTLKSDDGKQSFVLVLVDGNDYIFHEELVRDKEEGGMRAARLLNDAVEKYIYHSIHKARTARIVVRIYADLTTLSKQLARTKVVGLEKRSIASFAAGFTRAFGLFDFVDALDGEGTELKIREQVQLASEDEACHHILFAACHNPAHLSHVTPLSGRREKMTLVQSAGWNADFNQFNLNLTQFPTVFRWSELQTGAPSVKASPAATPSSTPYKAIMVTTRPALRTNSWRRDAPVSGSHSALSSPEMVPVNPRIDSKGIKLGTESGTPQGKSKQPCRNFPKGTCRFGDRCSFAHIPTRKPSTASSCTPTSPPSQARPQFSLNLPRTPPPGLIPVNALNQRLDPYIRSPTNAEWALYKSHYEQHKPCNTSHLQKSCTNLDCPFDHSVLEPEARHVLRYLLRTSGCSRRNKCRLRDCYHGHLCQIEDCEGSGTGKACRIGAWGHGVELRGVALVPAEGAEEENGDEKETGGLEAEARANGHLHGDDANLLL